MHKDLGFDRLKVFYYVFSEKSVIAAAKSLHISQSAVSQSIQKLESELKTLLFTRLHKQMIPTAAGKRLYSVIEPFILELDMCLKSFEQSKERPFGELRIGAPVEFGKAYFPAIVAAFQKKYPDVTFFIELGDQGALLPALQKGHIDFALVDVFQTQSQPFEKYDLFEFVPMVEEEVVLVCSSRYYEDHIKNDHSFKHLVGQGFITYHQDAPMIKAWFKHHFGKSNLKITSALNIDSHQAIISAIQHHVGMGVIASHFVRNELESGQIIKIETSKPEINNQISLTQLQDKIPTYTEKVFQEFMLKKIKSMGLS